MTEKEMLELMKQALEPVHEKLTVLDTKMTSLDEKVNSLDAKVTSLDEKVNSLDTKVASLDAKVNSLDTKVASLDAKVNSLDADVRGIKVVLENEVRRDLNLLAEGHAAILERLPSQEEKEALEARMDAMEAAIRLHSKQIRELKKAQCGVRTGRAPRTPPAALARRDPDRLDKNRQAETAPDSGLRLLLLFSSYSPWQRHVSSKVRVTSLAIQAALSQFCSKHAAPR